MSFTRLPQARGDILFKSINYNSYIKLHHVVSMFGNVMFSYVFSPSSHLPKPICITSSDPLWPWRYVPILRIKDTEPFVCRATGHPAAIVAETYRNHPAAVLVFGHLEKCKSLWSFR